MAEGPVSGSSAGTGGGGVGYRCGVIRWSKPPASWRGRCGKGRMAWVRDRNFPDDEHLDDVSIKD